MEQLTKHNFRELLAISDRLLLIEFYKDNCSHCCSLLSDLTELEKCTQQPVSFSKVNVHQELELTNQYDVDVLPTLLYIVRGEVRERLEGYYPSLVIQANMYKLLHLIA